MRELTPELRALSDLARAAAEGPYEVRDLLDRICASIVDTFGFERASVVEYDEDRRTLTPVASRGVALEALPPAIPIETQPIFERSLAEGGAVFVEDVRDDRALSPELVEAFGVRSVLVVPLVSGGRCLGFASADRGGDVFRLDEVTLAVLTTIGQVAAVFLAQAREGAELRRLDELKTQFVALASHELRAPVAVVHGIAATLAARGDDLEPELLLRLREALAEHTSRLRLLVDQLLDLSRLEAGGVEISPKRIRVRDRVADVVRTATGDGADEIRIEIPPDLEAEADPNAFDRIVANLVTNACRYGEAPVVVSASQSDRHFRLAVEDRGRGVTEEFVPRLFDRFTRSEESNEGVRGAGLGLSIVRSYAEAHGGQVLYRPAEPRGARFELILPSTR
ncbi:MAG: GAF domain-containing sensor histidine kinase [Actinomycetota bacterium]|nr:GAF domain-containing sensor histidine kinase [Actinomycetota bacterium]